MDPELKNHYAAEEEDTIDLRDFLFKLYKRRHIIISFIVVFTTVTLIYSFTAIPIYKATSRILIETQSPKVVKFEDVEVPNYSDIMMYVNSQVEILKSNIIAHLVDEDLGGYQPWGMRKTKVDFNNKPLSEKERLKSLLDSVKVKASSRSQIVEISVEDGDPALAAKIANAWIYAYIAYPLESEAYLNKKASAWLEKGVDKAKARLQKAEDELNRYRREHNLISFTDSGATSESTLFEQLVKKKSELEVELAQQLNYYKAKHPVIIGLKSELKSIDDKIAAESESKEKAVQYTILKREVETSRALYESLVNRLMHSEAIAGLKSNVKIVDEAQVPKYPSRPKKKMNVLMALFFGFFAGTGVALIFESLDLSIKSPEDIKNVVNLSFLGIVPIYSRDKDAPAAAPGEEESSPVIDSLKDHFSSMSESYRSLRTNIIFSNPDMKKKVFLITSPGPQEGKSTTATNLAIVMAQSGEKTILIDADFRRPSLHSIFAISRLGGITEILAENERNFTSHIHHTDFPNLDLLVCGSIPPNPSELLGSKKMGELIEELSRIYDRLIIDSPPVLAATDPVILSTKVEVVIMVVKANHTHKAAAVRTKELLSNVGAKIMGVVLNMVELKKRDGYYYYYYHYGYKNKNSGQTTKETAHSEIPKATAVSS